MDNPKLVIILPFPFEPRDYQRFGIDYFKSRDINVEVWDFSPHMSPERYESNKKQNNICIFENYTAFESVRGALKALKSLKKDTVVLFVLGYSQKTFSYFRAISASGATYGTLLLGNLPRTIPIKDASELKKVRWTRLKSKTINLIKSPSKVFAKIKTFINTVPANVIGIRPYDFLLKGGSEASFNRGLIGPDTKILETHSFDYERYLTEIAKPSVCTEDYIVYLDEGLPFHPDYIQLGESRVADPESYYQPLCNFFDTLEKLTGLKVKISSHPRVTYPPEANYFDGRTVLAGCTPNLVRNCKFILAHSSTSIGFAVLFSKPIIILMTDQIIDKQEGYSARVMAYAVGTAPVHVADHLTKGELSKLLEINEALYANYKNRYLKNINSKDTPIWEVFRNYIANCTIK